MRSEAAVQIGFVTARGLALLLASACGIIVTAGSYLSQPLASWIAEDLLAPMPPRNASQLARVMNKVQIS